MSRLAIELTECQTRLKCAAWLRQVSPAPATPRRDANTAKPRTYTDEHGFFKSEYRSVRIRVNPWLLFCLTGFRTELASRRARRHPATMQANWGGVQTASNTRAWVR